MTTPNLDAYYAIESHLFVRIVIDEYRTTPSGAYTSQTLRLSDMTRPYTVNGENYNGLGRLMSISSSNSELRVSAGEVIITLAGIPNSSIAEIVNSKIKGSSVQIYRGLFNSQTGAWLSIAGNPVGRFTGFVNNYSLNEEYDVDTRTSTNTLVLTCTSTVDVLANKVAGRRTNPQSEKKFYPDDLGMDRVPTLVNATFNFGAPQ